jgi:hypothetical protein
LGYRDRQVHKQQQKQQAIGGSYTPERMINLPAPKTMNTRDNVLELPEGHCPLLINAFPSESGLKLYNAPQIAPKPVLVTATAFANFGPLISYYGSGSTSSEFWAITTQAYRLTDTVGLVVSATATIEAIQLSGQGDWTEFNKTIIYVAGTGGASGSRKWTRASGWTTWDVSISASASAGNLVGITNFKNRLIGWQKQDTKFWYGSTDEVQGVMNPYEIGGVIKGVIRQCFSLSRDGGAGPDDYLAFVSDQGDVAVYEGTDPADASNWGLVGVYKIGRPVSRDSHVAFGNQVVVMCEDDFYFLPREMSGEKRFSVAARQRQVDDGDGVTNGVYDNEVGKIIWSDGTVLDPHRDYSYSIVTLTSADPIKVTKKRSAWVYDNATSNDRPKLGEFRGRSYFTKTFLQDGQGDENVSKTPTVHAIFRNPGGLVGSNGSKVMTKPIVTTGRTQIHLIAPQIGAFHTLSGPMWSASAPSTTTAPYTFSPSAPLLVKYRTGVLWDQPYRPYLTASTDSTVLTSVEIGSSENVFNTFDRWVTGAGNGYYAQLYIETSAPQSSIGISKNDVILYNFKATVSDTGGL